MGGWFIVEKLVVVMIIELIELKLDVAAMMIADLFKRLNGDLVARLVVD